MIRYTKINNSISVSQLCFGCEALGGTDCGTISVPDITTAIHMAVESGINFFDTADVYGLGLSESHLSDVLSQKRHDMIIATKVGVAWKSIENQRAKTWKDSSSVYIKKAVENSLRRLRLDVLPVVYSHWPDEKTSIEETFTAFNELITEGKILLLGCSNYMPEKVKIASQHAPISVIQIPLNILEGELSAEMVQLCRENEIKIVAYNALANGLLTGKFNRQSSFAANDRRHRLPLFQKEQFSQSLSKIENIKTLARKNNLTITQYALDWVLRQPYVASVITGIKSPQQLEENISSFMIN